MPPVRDCPVLVVGGALTGLSCAAFLAHHGVACTLVERHPDLLSHPRQRSLVSRSVELYRQIGLEPAIRAAKVDLVGPTEYVAVRADTLASPVYSEVDRPDPAALCTATPCPGTPIDQDSVERLLRVRATELGARMHFGTRLCGFRQQDDAVLATLQDPDGTEYQIRARYLVAADGAESQIRAQLGVPMLGPGGFFHLLTLMIEADLRPALNGRTVHMAYLQRPRPRTFLMALDLVGRRWVFGTTDDPRAGPLSETDCVELVRAATGLPDLTVRVLPQIAGTAQHTLRFRVGAAVAERYRTGRVFLIGDAAHLMPPTGGFGGATGVQDAHNLAWKLATVLRGRAGDRLLDSYHDERHPAALFTLQQALARARMRFSTDPDTPAEPSARSELVDRETVLMGQQYCSGAVCSAGERVPRRVTELSGEPGTRAPHVALTDDPSGPSTIDLYGSGFVLLVGRDGGSWLTAARHLPVPVHTQQFGRHIPVSDAVRRHGIGPGGAVLVRPDGIVAWRSTGAVADPAARLREVFRTILS